MWTFYEDRVPFYLVGEPSLRRKAQYGWPRVLLIEDQYIFILKMLFFCCKTSYLIKKAGCTEPSLSLSVSWFNWSYCFKVTFCCSVIAIMFLQDIMWLPLTHSLWTKKLFFLHIFEFFWPSLKALALSICLCQHYKVDAIKLFFSTYAPA